MTELKTKKTTASVTAFLDSLENKAKKEDGKKLLEIFKEATGKKPAMWGESIIGFGSYHYKYKSGREGDWPLTGFSPRQQQISIYIMPGFQNYADLLAKLGKHKVSKGSCLYVKKIADIDKEVLKELIRISVEDMGKMYETN